MPTPLFNQCVVCAWRENCKIKYIYSGSRMNCPHFTYDVRLQKENTSQTKEESKDAKSKDD